MKKQMIRVLWALFLVAGILSSKPTVLHAKTNADVEAVQKGLAAEKRMEEADNKILHDITDPAAHQKDLDEVDAARDEAEKWYRVAVGYGNLRGEYLLGELLYAKGMVEEMKKYARTQKNEDVSIRTNSSCIEGVRWIRKAADKGYIPAEYAMGSFYESGDPFDKNLAKAKAWYRKAADKGDKDALEALNKLKTTK